MSARKKFLHLAAAVEDIIEEQLNPTPPGPTDQELEANVNGWIDEADERIEVVQDACDQTDAAVQDTEDLEKLGQVVAATNDGDGQGLTTAEAETVTAAVESLYRRLGLTHAPALAFEAYGNARTRKMATRLSVETIKNDIKNAWQKIKAFVLRIWQEVKKFFNSITTSVEALNKQVKLFEDELVKKRSLKQTRDRITIPPEIVKKLMNSASLEAKDVVAGLKKVGEFSIDPIANLAQLTTGMLPLTAEVITIRGFNQKSDGGRMKVTSHAPLGDCSIEWHIEPFDRFGLQPPEFSKAQIKSLRAEFVHDHEKASAEAGVSAMKTADEIGRFVDAITAGPIKVLGQVKAGFPKLDKGIQDVVKTMDSMVGEQDPGPGYHNTRRLLQEISRTSVTIMMALARYNFTTAQAALKYARLSAAGLQ